MILFSHFHCFILHASGRLNLWLFIASNRFFPSVVISELNVSVQMPITGKHIQENAQ
ncbi:hypothetical protein PANT111_250020 [Pantoea brenneri]|uniref:Uncharacterized protein n=1 Tax=Pantoea brenneri TaxID=472694 RepID=A0AAX3J8Y9_9GAMM|nr:hypothetical protein PANT111_250020 [Pantoea brenneri]